MICRSWHGWTSPSPADAYEQLLREEIFVGIARRGIAGFRGIELLRRDEAAEVVLRLSEADLNRVPRHNAGMRGIPGESRRTVPRESLVTVSRPGDEPSRASRS